MLPVKLGTKSNELFSCPLVYNDTDHTLIIKMQLFFCGRNIFCSHAGVGHAFTWISVTYFAQYQQAVITGKEMEAGRSLIHWIIESAVHLEPIKMLILSTKLFSVLTQSGWSVALCIA